jgi:hypothetical protein
MIEPIFHKFTHLTVASIQGNSDISLEQSLEVYNGAAEYPMDFGTMGRNPMGDRIIGIFEQPTPGCVQISYFPAYTPQYYVTGHSIGDTVIDVLKEYALVIGLEPTGGQPDTQRIRMSLPSVEAQDRLLSGMFAGNKEQAFLRMLYMNHDPIQYTYNGVLTHQTAEELAKERGFDLSYYARHEVTFSITLDRETLAAKKDRLLENGIIEASPEMTLALVDDRPAIPEIISPNKIKLGMSATALVRRA